jgi:hypothetical protein
MPPTGDPPHVSPATAAVEFSQANKLCFRATPAQSPWLAEHMAATGLSISHILRAALDLYIAAHQPPNTPLAFDP